MGSVVELRSNGRRRKRRRRGRRKSSSRRRRRKNPRTFGYPYAQRVNRRKGRRRRTRRNPFKVGGIIADVKSAVPAAVAASLAATAGWAATATMVKDPVAKTTGATGYLVNLAGGAAFAVLGSMVSKKESVRRGLWIGAVMSPILRLVQAQLRAGQPLQGMLSRMGVRTGFEGYSTAGLEDYLVAADTEDQMADYLIPASSDAAPVPGSPETDAGAAFSQGYPGDEFEVEEALGYGEGGQNPFGSD